MRHETHAGYFLKGRLSDCSSQTQGDDMDLIQADNRSAEACCMPQPPPEKVTSESYVLLTPIRHLYQPMQ